MQRHLCSIKFALVPLVAALAVSPVLSSPVLQMPQAGYFAETATSDFSPSCDSELSFRGLGPALALVALPCDLDGNRTCGCSDIDLISGAIGEGNDDEDFDLNEDGIVNSDDREFLILDLMGVPYGDVNFDGQFDSRDLVHVFQAGHYGDMNPSAPVSYCEGDWNGDTVFDSSDLVLVFQRNLVGGSSFAVSSVPEPSILTLVAFGALCLLRRK